MNISLKLLAISLSREYDVFIASASYEERSLSIINSINDKIHIKHKLISISTPHRDLMVSNIIEFESKGFLIIEVDHSNQIKTITNIVAKINEVLEENKNSTFLVDITTFNRLTLLILLRILRNSLTKDNLVTFLYTPAKEYSIGLPYEEKWLTRGTLEVNSVFGYSGVIRPSRPYHLVILMGYEVERAISLINAYEPSKISVGYGRKESSISQDHHELNKKKFNELLDEFPNAESFEFSCVDVIECKNDILNQISKHTGYNIVISPLNNKISTLACGLAAFYNEEIQVAVAIPALYNHENYSTPGDCCHIIAIPDFIKTNI